MAAERRSRKMVPGSEVPTQQQVADSLAISRATVDRALNNRERVNEETKRRGCDDKYRRSWQPSNLIMAILAVKEGSVLISPAVARKLVRRLDPKEGEKEIFISEKWIEELTRREKQVLLFLSQGYSNEEISRKLSIEEQTVRNHVSMIHSKIGIHDRIELMLAVNRLRK